MQGRVPPQVLAEIKARVNLVELIGRYVELKRAGRSYKAPCPFHKETAPSFVVNEEMGTYHCFGCQAHGDAFRFLMAVENLSFFEAVKQLAAGAGVELPELRPPTPEETRALSEKEAVFKANELAMAFFEKALLSHEGGKVARAYIEKRGINAEMQRVFRLGYAPDSWDATYNALRHEGLAAPIIEKAGLGVPGTRGLYDRFRHRLMFPIIMQHEQVVGFGGRILGDRDEAKYINSPESPVFIKSNSLYGYHAARATIGRANRVIIVEGNVDVVMMHQHGFTETVATLGTALTETHIRFLKRMTRTIYIVYDGDAAGKKAMFASLERFFKFEINARAVLLPGGHDPDTFLRENGAAGFSALIAQARYLFDIWLEDQYLLRAEGPKGASDCLHRVVPMLGKIADPVERDLYVQRVAAALGIREVTIRQELRRHGSRQNWEAGPSEAIVRQTATAPGEEALATEFMLFELAVFHGALLAKSFADDEILLRLKSLPLVPLIESALAQTHSGGKADSAVLLDLAMDESWKNRIAKLLFNAVRMDTERALGSYSECVARLALRDLEDELATLEVRVREAQTQGDRDQAGQLALLKLSLLKRRDSLRREIHA